MIFMPLILLFIIAVMGTLVLMATLKFVLDFKYSGIAFRGANKYLEMY